MLHGFTTCVTLVYNVCYMGLQRVLHGFTTCVTKCYTCNITFSCIIRAHSSLWLTYGHSFGNTNNIKKKKIDIKKSFEK